jgi:hypothetical protein
MDKQTAELDQADEEILTYTVSDEELEAAAGTEGAGAGATLGSVSLNPKAQFCCYRPRPTSTIAADRIAADPRPRR